MLEVLLSGSSSVIKEYPNSGPGSKRLIAGNEDIGYFGEVPASSLITHAALRTHIGLVAGSNIADSGWLKFFHKGVVKYVCKTNTFVTVTWANLYAAGALYGTNDNGVVPGAPAVNQYKPLTINDGDVVCTFAPKLISGSPLDPTGIGAVAVTDYDSEFSDLLYRVVVGGHVNAGKFAQNTAVAVGMNVAQTMLNTATGTVGYHLVRGYPAYTNGSINANGQSLRKDDRGGYNQQCRMVLVLKSPL